ncbi:hypothetical protein FJT64_026848 [Amphibalanus amphitrite]|uniref:DUF7789 domain-containing protein n=1 Tax=Amphibalanus amphitrite TaxID=1232801 RepID=A0A6A4WA71_AMPAM|nr:hypothetical protein FJT64_026848 [Amphibalanus amphitrite]
MQSSAEWFDGGCAAGRQIRSLASLDRLEWAFLVGSLLATLATAGLGTARLLSLPPQSDDRVFVWLLLLTAGFALVYSVNGVLREQVYELLVYALTAAVLAVYVLLNYLDPDTPRGAIKLARLVVAGLCSPPLVVAAVTLAGRYWQCGELVFRTVGANPALQQACRRVLTAQSLLKLDAQLALSTAVLVVRAGGPLSAAETAVLAAGAPLSLLWWAAGYAALRWESARAVRWLLAPTALLEPAYIVWRLATERRPDGVLLQCERAAGALALLVRLLLVICLLSCANQFGLGVSEHMYPARRPGGGDRPPRYGSFGSSGQATPRRPAGSQ